MKGNSHSVYLDALFSWLTSRGVHVKVGRSAGKGIECTTLIDDKAKYLIVFKKNPHRSLNATFYIGVHEAAHLMVSPRIGEYFQEIIAESVAYLVCQALKLDVAFSSTKYLRNYIIGCPPEMLVACASISKGLCKDVVNGLNGVISKWENQQLSKQ